MILSVFVRYSLCHTLNSIQTKTRQNLKKKSEIRKIRFNDFVRRTTTDGDDDDDDDSELKEMMIHSVILVAHRVTVNYANFSAAGRFTKLDNTNKIKAKEIKNTKLTHSNRRNAFQ